MRVILCAVMLLSVVCSAGCGKSTDATAPAQVSPVWTPLSDGLSGVVYDLSSNGGALWASTSAGLFRLDGASWTPIRTVAVSKMLTCGASYLTTERNDIYRSVDGGARWERVFSAAYDFTGFCARGTTAWASNTSGNVYRSRDAGATWEVVGAPGAVVSLLANGTKLLAGTSVGLMASLDDGVSWRRGYQPNGSSTAYQLSGSGSVVLAACGRGGVNVSLDGGYTWKMPVSPPSGNRVYSVAASDAAMFCANDGDGVYWSKDVGNTWEKLGENTLQASALLASGRTLYVGTLDSGVWRCSF